MKELWKQKVVGEPDDLLYLSGEVKDFAPGWLLHGMTPLGEESDELYSACIWGEYNLFTCGLTIRDASLDDAPLTEEQRDAVLKDAAIQACIIALRSENYDKVGEVFLNKHPECRNHELADEAIIDAALAEREALFSDEDYREF